MKHIVNLPSHWEFQLISHWSQYFFDFKWSFLFWGDLFVMIHLQIPCVKPDLLVFFKWGEVQLFSIGYSCSCQFMSSQCFFSVIDHSFHLLLDRQIFGVGECNWDGDWTIALYQFEWGVNSFYMSSIIVREFQCAWGM